MSTKTTFKRIALVAVAALGFGMLSVAPSNAAANTVLKFASGGDGAGADNSTGYGIAGAFNFVNLTADSWSATVGNDYVVTTDGTFGAVASGATVAADRKSFVAEQLQTTFQVMTPTVGTITVNYWKRTAGVLAAAAFETVVITVSATKQKGTFSAANSTAFMVAGETNTAWSATADATVTPVATSNADTAVASIAVSLKDALKLEINDTVTATVVAGGANVRVLDYSESATALTNGVTPGTVSANKLSTSGKALVLVYANGIAGAAQIRLSLSDGTVLATKTVTFSSTTVATLEATVVTKYVSSTGKAGAITVVAKDAAGNVINGASITATSGTTTAIASPSPADTADGKASFTVAAASATATGASVITFKSGTATTTATITAAGVKATVLTITPSADTANAGDKITYTMTVADANGPLADGDYVGVFVSAPVTSSGADGAFKSETVTVKDGVATSEIFLPFVAGNYTSTWTLKAASANLDAALAATKITSTVVVANPGVDAATDAANEATDAANAATDAALAAAEAADAATSAAQEASDAVAALSESVTKLIAGLQAQIKSLAAVVARIAKQTAKIK